MEVLTFLLSFIFSETFALSACITLIARYIIVRHNANATIKYLRAQLVKERENLDYYNGRGCTREAESVQYTIDSIELKIIIQKHKG